MLYQYIHSMYICIYAYYSNMYYCYICIYIYIYYNNVEDVRGGFVHLGMATTNNFVYAQY